MLSPPDHRFFLVKKTTSSVHMGRLARAVVWLLWSLEESLPTFQRQIPLPSSPAPESRRSPVSQRAIRVSCRPSIFKQWRERKTYNLLRKTWSGLLASLGLVWWVSPIAPTMERLRPNNLELQDQGRQQKETKMCHASWCVLECILCTPRREEIKGLPCYTVSWRPVRVTRDSDSKQSPKQREKFHLYSELPSARLSMLWF